MRKNVIVVGFAAMFIVAGPRAASAQPVTLYTVDFADDFRSYTLGTFGNFQAPQSPSELLFGHRPPRGVPVAEVAVEQQILHPGDLVPLPRYADGTEAAESEVFWTVHLWQAHFHGPSIIGGRFEEYTAATGMRGGDIISVGFSGRLYGGGTGRLNPTDEPALVPFSVDVMVTVIATRAASVIPVRSNSWSELKARFR